MRIVFMGSPAFAVPTLAALIASEHDVVAVYSQPPKPAHRGQKETKTAVHQLAEKHGIAVHTPASLKNIEMVKADVAIVAAYGLLLPQTVLDAFPFGCINVHPSLLPRWRGAAPIQRAILAGDDVTGVCIMKMEAGLDTGSVFMRREEKILATDNASSLHDRLAFLGAKMILETLEKLPENFSPLPQKEQGVTYAYKLKKEEAVIDWKKSAREIDCQIRGLFPWPKAETHISNERVQIHAARIENGKGNAGEVIDSDLGIATSDGILRPEILQREGKKPITRAEFLRGFSVAKGTKL